MSIAVPVPGARRATGEGRHKGWQKPQRFAARQTPAVGRRLLRGEALARVARALGLPAARRTTWRAAGRAAGQAARPQPPRAHHDRVLARVRHNRGAATRAMARCPATRGRRATARPGRARRARRGARPARPPRPRPLAWHVSAACGASRAPPHAHQAKQPRKLLWHYRVATHTIMPISQELPYDDHTTGGPCHACNFNYHCR